ncbi:hypothetical protein ACQ4PT_070074 [Festuca glaucescens]
MPVEAPPVVPAVKPEECSKWSSLPPDLVRRIADCFLAADDLDCYMDFRAVCPSWRDATDDPKNHASDERFRPRRWIILDEHFQTEGNLLLLHTASGRFLRRKLPLRLELDYYVVATAFGGFFILADTGDLPTQPASSTLSPAPRPVSRRLCPRTRWSLTSSAATTTLRSSSFCSATHLTSFTQPVRAAKLLTLNAIFNKTLIIFTGRWS